MSQKVKCLSHRTRFLIFDDEDVIFDDDLVNQNHASPTGFFWEGGEELTADALTNASLYLLRREQTFSAQCTKFHREKTQCP